MKVKILKAESKTGFKFLAGINRNVIPAHVSKMSESVQAIGFIRPVVVSYLDFVPGDPDWYIIDGQHLYLAGIRLKADIPYVEIEIDNLVHLIKTMADLNSTSKNWTIEDYVNTWSCYRDDYKELKRLFQLYNVERLLLAELLHTGTVNVQRGGHGGTGGMSRVIKKGDFRIINYKSALQILDYIADLRSVTKDLGRDEQRLLIALLVERIKADEPNYDHEAFKKRLITIKNELVLVSHDVDAVRRLLRGY